MAQFAYKAFNRDGVSYEGESVATDTFALSRDLHAKGETLIIAIPVSVKKFSFKKILQFGTVSEQEKVVFARSLGNMISAGLPLARSLSVLSRQARNPRLVSIIDGIAGEVREGKALNAALSTYPKVFSSLFVAMIRAGEESGNLAESLRILSDQMNQSYTLKKRLRGAMVYPAVIVTIMVLLGILMFFFVVPTLTETFSSLDVELPLSTRMIIGASNILTGYPLQLFSIVIILIGLGIMFIRSARGKRIADYMFVRIPIIKNIVKEANAARTTRTFSALLSSGVEIVRALEITYDVVGNSYFKEVIKESSVAIQKGRPISEVFARFEHLYPPLVAEMMSVGEETGKLSEMMVNLATYYEDEVSRKTKDLSTIVEPILMVVIGAGVGFFAFSVITPIYSIMDTL